MLHNIILFTMSVIENIVIIQIVNSFFKVKNKTFEYLFILLFSLFSYYINTMNHPLFLLAAVMILIVYTCYNNYGLWMQKALVAIAVFGLNAYLSFIIVSGLNYLDTTVAHLIQDKLSFYVCIVIITKFLLITIFSFMKTLFQKHDDFINWKLILLELSLFFLSILLSFYIYINSYIKADVTFILLLIIACTLCILFYFYNAYVSSKRKKELQEIWETERKDYINQSQQLHCFYDKSFTNSKALKHQFDQLHKTIDAGDTSHSLKILDDINQQLFSTISFGNEALDFLLNSKLQIMQEFDIRFQAAVSTSLEDISQDDITYLIGMMLDSAIEQVKNKEDASITLQISKVSAGTKIFMEYGPAYDFKEISHLFAKLDPLIKKYHGFSNHHHNQWKTCFKFVFVKDETSL